MALWDSGGFDKWGFRSREAAEVNSQGRKPWRFTFAPPRLQFQLKEPFFT